jgi:hypothetical protein
VPKAVNFSLSGSSAEMCFVSPMRCDTRCCDQLSLVLCRTSKRLVMLSS